MTSPGIEPATFRLVAECPSHPGDFVCPQIYLYYYMYIRFVGSFITNIGFRVNKNYRHSLNSSVYISILLITVGARCKAWNFSACCNTGIVGSNLTWGMDVCVFICVCVVLCAGSSLATGWSPVQGILPTVSRLNWKAAKVQQRTVEPQIDILILMYCPAPYCKGCKRSVR
jgi:hypothetical protein